MFCCCLDKIANFCFYLLIAGTPGATTPGATSQAVTLAGPVTGTGLAAGQPPPTEPPHFTCPRRPNLGREGRPIGLRANHFQISMPRGFVHHYDVNIQPDKCPRKVSFSIS